MDVMLKGRISWVAHLFPPVSVIIIVSETYGIDSRQLRINIVLQREKNIPALQ